MRGARTSSTSPIGTLTSSAQRQPAPVTITPPTTCPAHTPSASTIAYRPTARSREGPSKRRWITCSVCGVISAAHAPWASRPISSTPGLHASPHSSEVAVKPARPVMNMRPWPRSSPSRAPVTTSTPNANV